MHMIACPCLAKLHKITGGKAQKYQCRVSLFKLTTWRWGNEKQRPREKGEGRLKQQVENLVGNLRL